MLKHVYSQFYNDDNDYGNEDKDIREGKLYTIIKQEKLFTEYLCGINLYEKEAKKSTS
jgi:hypothetical protein